MKPKAKKTLSVARTKDLLGASSTVPVGRISGDPFALKFVGAHLRERLLSSGGRPTDPTWDTQRKIPMKQQTWAAFELMADGLHHSGTRIAAGQLAAVALEEGLKQIVACPDAYGLPSSRRRYSFSAHARAQAASVHSIISQRGVW
jgi:hypothetical protein